MRGPRRWRDGLLLLVLILALGGCSPAEPVAQKRQFFSLGTVVELSLWDVDEARAGEATRAVESILSAAQRRWHAWEPSELTEVNEALARGETVRVDEETRRLLASARALSLASGDRFNPGIGRLVALWGFHASEQPTGPPPSQEAIAAWLADQPSMRQLRLDGNRVSAENPAIQLDLGAHAKGYAIDQAIEALTAMGIGNAIVNAGGDLRAIGQHGARPWRIGIRDPRSPGVFASLEVTGDESVFTSGDYERFFTWEGKRFHHILDPRTGMPAGDTRSVTVIHPSAAVADAAATALFVAGPEDWPATAAGMGITHVMLIAQDMRTYLTPAMAERIRFEAPEPAELIVVEAAR